MIDRTHLGRRSSGLERITRDLFAQDSLAPLRLIGTPQSSSRLGMMARQMLANPLQALAGPGSVWVFPGYPPSPLFGLIPGRSVLYVHDLFLADRPADLNRAARWYMAPCFRSALRRLRVFLANSETTAANLRPHVAGDATIQLYRPPARDILGLSGLPPAPGEGPVTIGMMGTIEPRKNYSAAVPIRQALERRLGRPVVLEVVGRPGWGGDAAVLERDPGTRLRGFVADADLAGVVQGWHLFLSTSHDEGLGLPLLEVQHAGRPVAAPDQPVFREVLDGSGVFIDPAEPEQAAERLAAALARPAAEHAAAGRRNIERWNDLAAHDRPAVIALLQRLARGLARGTA